MLVDIMEMWQDVQRKLAGRFQARRLSMNLSQEGLARRAGVSLGSLKRFERMGLISLDSMLRLAVALECLEDFDGVCADRGGELEGKSLDEILAAPKQRRKGRIK